MATKAWFDFNTAAPQDALHQQIDIDDVKSNIFTISFNNLWETPTKFVYESYRKIIFIETEKYFDPNKIAILPIYK